MNDGNHTGNAQKLPIAERARTGALLSEPALLLTEVLELEHSGAAARLALKAEIDRAVEYKELSAVYVPIESEPGALLVFLNSGYWLIDRESYRAWRAQCPKSLLSDLSKIGKWLGAMPTPVESLPESLPVESLPTKRQRDDALSLAIQAALGAGVVPHPRELFDYLKASDKTLTITGVSKDGKALLWESSSGSLQKTDIRALAKRLKRQ